MATIPKPQKVKPKLRSSIPNLLILVSAIGIICIYTCLISTNEFSINSITFIKRIMRPKRSRRIHTLHDKYLYWGFGIDCPGIHCDCDSCQGFGHQESSLRCALQEALFLNRTFIMPSRMCISPIHNQKGILHHSAKWKSRSCNMASLYDIDFMSETVPVMLDNSIEWFHVVSIAMKLGSRGIAHVRGVSRFELKQGTQYTNMLLINRTANPLSWFMECKERSRSNHSDVVLPNSFLPSVAAERLRDAADMIIAKLGEYDAIHVRRGDKVRTRKDRYGVVRSLNPHLDRDTRPEYILKRIEKWVPTGRTIFIASNERTPGFFSPLAIRYKLAYSSNYSKILEPLIQNNYELFMVERLVMMGAKTIIKTFKEDDVDLSLTDG
ncbi:hypothetical protein LINPERPRIM_LOCUS30989 [Linum perenne]